MIFDPEDFDKKLQKYRTKTFRTSVFSRVRSIEDALDFVNERGFIFFWPIKGFVFPSLWAANAGDRVVPDNHDDPGHVTWDWKDKMLGQKKWYYGRVLKRKNTIISLETLPYFYALSPNYGEYESDYQTQYEQGLLTAESKAVYEALLTNGPMDTLMLRKFSHMTSQSSSSRFQRALDQLQMEFKILPVGVSEAGAWNYAFMYDVLPRHFEWIEEKAGIITEPEARAFLLKRYLISMGADDLSRIRSMFRWDDKTLQRTIHRVMEENSIKISSIELDGKPALTLDDLL